MDLSEPTATTPDDVEPSGAVALDDNAETTREGGGNAASNASDTTAFSVTPLPTPPLGDSAQVALFVDWENLKYSLRERGEEPDINALVRAARAYGRLTIARAYAEWTDIDHRRNNDAFHLYRAGIEPIYVPCRRSVASNERVRNSVDVKMLADCLETSFTSARVETFVIVSGDQSLLHITPSLQGRDKNVVVIGVQGNTAGAIQSRSDAFHFYHNLLRGDLSAAAPAIPGAMQENENGGVAAYENGNGGSSYPASGGRTYPPVASSPRAVSPYGNGGYPPPAPQQTGGYGEAGVGEYISIQALTERIVGMIRARRDEGRNAPFTYLGSQIKRVVPNFNSMTYGFLKFGDLMQYLAADTQAFRIVKISDAQYYALLPGDELVKEEPRETRAPWGAANGGGYTGGGANRPYGNAPYLGAFGGGETFDPFTVEQGGTDVLREWGETFEDIVFTLDELASRYPYVTSRKLAQSVWNKGHRDAAALPPDIKRAAERTRRLDMPSLERCVAYAVAQGILVSAPSQYTSEMDLRVSEDHPFVSALSDEQGDDAQAAENDDEDGDYNDDVDETDATAPSPTATDNAE